MSVQVDGPVSHGEGKRQQHEATWQRAGDGGGWAPHTLSARRNIKNSFGEECARGAP